MTAVRNWLYGGALLVIAVAMLTYVQLTMADMEQDAVAKRIAGGEQQAMLSCISHLTERKPLRTAIRGDCQPYGFVGQDQLDAEENAWLTRLESTHSAPLGCP